LAQDKFDYVIDNGEGEAKDKVRDLQRYLKFKDKIIGEMTSIAEIKKKLRESKV